MQVPIHCPFCHDIMLTDFSPYGRSCRKACEKRLDHRFCCTSMAAEDNTVWGITMSARGVSVVFGMHTQTLSIFPQFNGILQGGQALPFFEPDLSKPWELMEKLKTYLIFS
jgi:hypothetical protein